MKNIVKALALICTIAMLFSFASCKKSDSDTPDTSDSETSTLDQSDTTTPDDENGVDMKETRYALNSGTKGIKILGERYLESADQLNCDWTCSGVELNVDHKGGNITFNATADRPVYFRAYVDGAEWKNDGDSVYYTVTDALSQITLKNVPAGTHNIKVIKATGYTNARAQLYNIVFAGTILEDQTPADKQLYTEFVGDDMTCGLGNIGEGSSAYTDQDGALAYPYMIAEALQADYSILGLSGQGLLVGNPGMTNGYNYASASRDTSEEYSFSRKADIVVINIGTNDYTKQAQYGIDEAKFKEAYLAFLENVYEKNGEDCQIYCLYNMKNDTFANAIQDAYEEFGGERKNAYLVKVDRNTSENGYPSVQEHEAYAQQLVGIMESNMDKLHRPKVEPIDITVQPSGNVIEIEYSND